MQRATTAALELSGNADETQSAGNELLVDVQHDLRRDRRLPRGERALHGLAAGRFLPHVETDRLQVRGLGRDLREIVLKTGQQFDQEGVEVQRRGGAEREWSACACARVCAPACMYIYISAKFAK